MLSIALAINSAADKIFALEQNFRVINHRMKGGGNEFGVLDNVSNGKKQVPPVITRHAPLNSARGVLEVKPIKTNARSSAPGRIKHSIESSEDPSTAYSSTSTSMDYLDIPNRMYELYDFSKTFWKQLDGAYHADDLQDEESTNLSKNDEEDVNVSNQGGFVRISSGHSADGYVDENVERLKSIDDIQMEVDKSDDNYSGDIKKAKKSSIFQSKGTAIDSEAFNLNEMLLLLFDFLIWGIQGMLFYFTRLISLTIEPFQDVSGVASIGPHIFVSLLILLVVTLFNSGDEDYPRHHHQKSYNDKEPEPIEDIDVSQNNSTNGKDDPNDIKIEEEEVTSVINKDGDKQEKLENGHCAVKDETEETPRASSRPVDVNTHVNKSTRAVSNHSGAKQSSWRSFWVPVLTAVFIWLYLTSIENIQRNRIVYKVESNTFKTLFETKNDVVNKICTSYTKFGKKAVDAYVDISMLDLLCSAHETSIGASTNIAHRKGTNSAANVDHTNIKSLFWLNKLLVSFWSVDSSGGLGPYFSQTIEEVLREQLAMVPPSIAQLSVKKFSVGSIPPIIRGVQVKSYFGEGSCQSKFHVASDPTVHREHSSRGPPGGSHSNESNNTQNTNRNNKNIKSRGGEGGKNESTTSTFSIKEEIQRQMDYTRQYLKMHGGGVVHDDHIYSECEHVIIDTDFSFSSEDMDIEFQLHSSTDGAIAIPDATVSVSHVLLHGKLRMDMESLPNFPFIGNTSIAFHQVPELDMAISSFGGVDLSILPGMHSWINVTLSWVLTQLAHPNYIKVDMLPLVCPGCVEVKVVQFFMGYNHNSLLLVYVLTIDYLFSPINDYTQKANNVSSWSVLNILHDMGNIAKRILIEKVIYRVSENLFGQRKVNKDMYAPKSGTGTSKSKVSKKERNGSHKRSITPVRDKDDTANAMNSISGNGISGDSRDGRSQRGADNTNSQNQFKIFDILPFPFN